MTSTTSGTSNTPKERFCLSNTMWDRRCTPRMVKPLGSLSSRRAAIRNPELSSVSMDGLCRAMSVETNSYVDWFRQWWDYGDVDAFFLNSGFSNTSRDISNSPPGLVSEEQLGKCLELHGLLDRFTMLDLGIARWRRSKRATTKEEQLVELRIAMESVLLADDKGAVGEKEASSGDEGGVATRGDIRAAQNILWQPPRRLRFCIKRAACREPQEEARGSAGQGSR